MYFYRDERPVRLSALKMEPLTIAALAAIVIAGCMAGLGVDRYRGCSGDFVLV
jgi:hypothetical protein